MNLERRLKRYLRDKCEQWGEEFFTTTRREIKEELNLSDEQMSEVLELMNTFNERGYFDTYWVEVGGAYYTVTLNENFIQGKRCRPKKKATAASKR